MNKDPFEKYARDMANATMFLLIMLIVMVIGMVLTAIGAI